MRKATFLAAAVLALGGCVSVGRPFRQGPELPSIIPGKTTQQEVRRLFGDPARVGTDAGEETWTYMDYKFGLFTKPRTEDLYIHFNADKTVRSYTFNTDFPGLPGSR